MKRKLFKSGCFVLIMLLAVFFTTGCGGSTDEASKVAVGISWCEDITVDESEYSEDLAAYITAVEQAGGEPVLLELYENRGEADKALDSVDALIITGGEDIDPAYYNEEPEEELEEVNTARDVSDMLLAEAVMDTDIPVLAICRGCQLINVAGGGSLTQDIPAQLDTGSEKHRSDDLVDFAYHNINIEEGSKLYEIMGTDKLKVNSWHHQSIKDLADGYTVSAVSDYGIIEAIERDDKGFFIGVQFHPEWHVVEGDTEHLKIFKALIKNAG